MCSPLFDELFVANLASDTTESDVKELFEPYAVVKECWVGRKKQLKGAANTSFSSVRVETHVQAVAAKKALHGTIHRDRNLVVKWAANQRLLWVGGLPESVTNEALQAGFSQFGTVERAVVVADAQNPASRRYGFVLFEEKRDAQKALSKCQEGVLLFAKSLEPVRVDWARIEDPYEGYSDALAASKKKGSDVNPAVVAHLASPGTQEHTVAMRVRQLQLQYQQTKAQLKAQIAAVLGNPALTQTAALPAMAPSMGMGGPQFMAQGPTMGPMGGMGSMAPLPMAPPPVQTPVQTPLNPMGMMSTPAAPPPNPIGSISGTLPTIGLGTAPAQPAPLMNQNVMIGKSMGENFHNVPPPSKTQLRKHDRPERFTPLPPKDGFAAPLNYAPPPQAPEPPSPAGGLRFVKAGSLSVMETAQSQSAPTSASPPAANVAGVTAQLPAASDPGVNAQPPAASASAAMTIQEHAAAGGPGAGAGAGSTGLSGALPGAKPPGSHDHRGIGFSGAAGSQAQTSYSNTAANVQGPRPPTTPYPSTTGTFGATTSVQPTVSSYPPPTSMGANFSAAGFNMGMPAYSAPQMQGMGTGGAMMQAGLNTNGFGVQGGQSGYTAGAMGTGLTGTMGMTGMGQFGMGQTGSTMQAAGMQPMSGYSAPTAFNTGTYAPPPQQY